MDTQSICLALSTAQRVNICNFLPQLSAILQQALHTAKVANCTIGITNHTAVSSIRIAAIGPAESSAQSGGYYWCAINTGENAVGDRRLRPTNCWTSFSR
ncbi:MAG: hypothetical protein MHMPM18_001862 [Marteilia pararefringens]